MLNSIHLANSKSAKREPFFFEKEAWERLLQSLGGKFRNTLENFLENIAKTEDKLRSTPEH